MSSEWRTTAEHDQQRFADLLGNRTWDRFSMPSDGDELSKKIAFALLGPPSDENDNKTFGYSPEEFEKVIEIKEKCIEYCQMQEGYDDSVCVAFIFVCAYHSDWGSTMTPLIRVKKNFVTDIRNSYFIDPCGTVYNTWEEYLEENIFDGWWICVPLGAVYSEDEKVKVEFIDQSSRALGAQNDVYNTNKRAFKNTEVMMSFFLDPVSVARAMTVVRAAVKAPGVAYGAGQSVCEQVDHSNHDESICLLDSEERALSVSRIAIFKSLIKLSEKDEVTPLDVLQLTAFIFFFTHSELSFKAASTLIKDVQDKKLSEKRQNLEPEEQKLFDIMLKGYQEMVTPGTVRKLHGNKEFIRELIRIGNLPEYFSNFSLVAGTLLNINKNLDIDPKAYFQMTSEQRDLILKQSQDLQNGKITHAQFDDNVGAISKDYRIRFEHQRQEARKKIQEAFQVGDVSEIVVAGERIFENLQPHELDRLDEVFTKAGKEYNPDRIEVGKVMGDILKCKNADDYTAVMEYFIRNLEKNAEELWDNNPNPIMAPGVSVEEHYFKIIAEEFLFDENKKMTMVEEFIKLREGCDAANNSGFPRFGGASTAANHYDKHHYFPCVDPIKRLPHERYFEIAREMTTWQNVDVNKPTWTQEGNLIRYTFVSLKYGATAVWFESLADGTSVIATLFRNNKLKGKSRLYSTVLKRPVN
jgi:hypothetical protein